jgi:ketosteroid isomerase-like protein
MKMQNEKTINTFYKAFTEGDINTMKSCYASNIEFEDPAFGKLTGNDVGYMWQMLLESSKGGLKITHKNVKVEGDKGSVNWKADYIFSKTGRKVVNRIKGTFEFNEGKIIKHTDDFNMWTWSQQALGVTGFLIGWTGFFQKKLQSQTNGLLKKFKAKNNLN